MKLKISILILILSASVVPGLFALPLGTIEIEGEIKKTRRSTIIEIIQFDEGDEINSGDDEIIRQRLIRSGLFVNESIATELILEDKNAVLRLILNDRFSLLPIPIVSSGDGGTKGGVFLVDSNLLGTGNQIFAGALFGTESQYASINYMDSKFMGSSFDFGGGFMYNNSVESIEDVDEREVYEVDAQIAGIALIGRWGQAPHSIGLAGQLSTADYKRENAQPLSLSPVMNYEYDNRYYGSYMSEGFNFGMEYEYSYFTKDFDPAQRIAGFFHWEELLSPRVQSVYSLKLMTYRGEDIQAPSLSSLLLSSELRGTVNSETSLGLRFVLADFSWAYLALPLSYSLGYLDGISAEDEIYHGPVGGLTLNLKEVAIPAISLYYGRNIPLEKNVVNFSIGMSR